MNWLEAPIVARNVPIQSQRIQDINLARHEFTHRQSFALGQSLQVLADIPGQSSRADLYLYKNVDSDGNDGGN